MGWRLLFALTNGLTDGGSTFRSISIRSISPSKGQKCLLVQMSREIDRGNRRIRSSRSSWYNRQPILKGLPFLDAFPSCKPSACRTPRALRSIWDPHLSQSQGDRVNGVLFLSYQASSETDALDLLGERRIPLSIAAFVILARRPQARNVLTKGERQKVMKFVLQGWALL